MFKLPPHPRGVRLLSNEESSRLHRLNPSVAECRTCEGRGTFRWYRYASADFDPEIHDGSEVVTFECSGTNPCDDQRILTKFLWNANIGLAYQRLGWHDARPMEPGAIDKAHDYLWRANDYVNAGIGFILHGEVGNGKTMLATLILKSLLAEGHDGYFTTFSELIDTFMSSWRDPEEKTWFYRRIKGAGILVIDDVGREHKLRRIVSKLEMGYQEPFDQHRERVRRALEDEGYTVRMAMKKDSAPHGGFMVGDRGGEPRFMSLDEARNKTGITAPQGVLDYSTAVAESVFDEVIRHRTAAARPTIVTTNWDLKKLLEGYGNNVMSLLAEQSIEYRMTGADFRPMSNVRRVEEIGFGLNRPVVLA